MALHIAFRHRLGERDFDVAIDVPTPGVTVLFGPSGAGKSTIVAVTAGLLRPATCHVAVDGAVLADSERGICLKPERRGVGMVFQDALLFPHLSVAANLRYGWRRAAERRIGWDEVIGLLGLADLLARRPASLSGGERQRVAIGRALLAQPRLLALDEPLASLDAPRRAEILPYLARLGALGLPILCVTHAIDEVAALADTLVLVEAGRIVAAGPLGALSARADLVLARRDDAAAVIACVVAEHLPSRGLTRLGLPGGAASLLVRATSHLVGAMVRARLPAGEVILARIAPVQISVHNILPVLIERIVADDTGRGALVELRLSSDAMLLARVTRDAVDQLGLMPGELIFALIKSVAIVLL